MFKNLRIASRYLFKHKEYTFINVGGLAFSLVCVFLIGLYLHDEISFDSFHADADRIYRVIEDKVSESGEPTSYATTAFLMATLPEEIPGIEKACLFTSFGRMNLSNPEKTVVFHYDAVFGDQNFLEIFSYPFVYGDRSTALKEPFTVILSESMAQRLFGSTDVVGKTLLGDNEPFKITGVFKDFPSNTHIDLSILYSMQSLASLEWYKRFQAGDWTSSYFPVYYKLKAGVDPQNVTQRLNEIVKAKRPQDAVPSRFRLQPITDIHFHSADIRGGADQRYGNLAYVYIFAAVGLFILIIACVNYINLTTAFSITRGKEIGVKKVAGAHRSQLISQFLTESCVIVFISVVIALAAVSVLLPAFNNFAGKTISTDLLFEMPTLVGLAIFTCVVGILSGGYPAFVLSRLKPVYVMKGPAKGSSSAWMRKGLVVFQFSLSIMLIIASITAYRQLQYIKTKNLGFNHEQLMMLDINSGDVRRGAQTIKTELMRIPSVKSVSVTSRVPGEWKNLTQALVTTADHPAGSMFYFIGADEDFLSTFEIKLIKGRNFRAGDADSLYVMINETAAKLLGIDKPGMELTIPSVREGADDEMLDNPFRVTVAGIVEDFHFQSLHQKIAPLIIAHSSNPIQSIDYFTVRLAPTNLDELLPSLEKAFASVDPDQPLEYNFLDDRLADFYKQDTRRGEIFGIAAFVSIAIACLGLFSLASFNTQQRTKEIGVRKVLGASLGQITLLLSGSYVRLVILGFLIAAPLSFLALREWLSSFAYRISIDATILLAAGFISVTIAILTVGYKSLRAAMADPVDSLRSE